MSLTFSLRFWTAETLRTDPTPSLSPRVSEVNIPLLIIMVRAFSRHFKWQISGWHILMKMFFSYCIKPFPAVDERLWSYLQRHVNPLAFSVQAPRVCLFNIVWSLPLISLLSLIVSCLFADLFCCGQHLILNPVQEPNHNDHLQNYHHPYHDQVNWTYDY